MVTTTRHVLYIVFLGIQNFLHHPLRGQTVHFMNCMWFLTRTPPFFFFFVLSFSLIVPTRFYRSEIKFEKTAKENKSFKQVFKISTINL